ncbi:hypothetical protein [Rhodanobacter denitrificans]|uniref:hypothetical protein n=1 Tax=Rhodanobacter denitrificans TaxID=666685 RepID=UPI0011C07B20|nr:hypothetical protein [Rhodanobacter denitrificans]
MSTADHIKSEGETTNQKQFWLQCYVSALTRLNPKEAAKEADESLVVCNERWATAPTVASWRFAHQFPVGTTFDANSDKNL